MITVSVGIKPKISSAMRSRLVNFSIRGDRVIGCYTQKKSNSLTLVVRIQVRGLTKTEKSVD
jgi:hypothetical protein